MRHCITPDHVIENSRVRKQKQPDHLPTPVIIQVDSSDPAPRQRGEDTAEAQDGEDDEGRVHAGNECGIIFRRYLDVADIHAEDEHYHPHAERHADLPHSR